jgi:hypothetical protein
LKNLPGRLGCALFLFDDPCLVARLDLGVLFVMSESFFSGQDDCVSFFNALQKAVSTVNASTF